MRLASNQELSELQDRVEREGRREREEVRRHFEQQLQTFRAEQEDIHNKVRVQFVLSFLA